MFKRLDLNESISSSSPVKSSVARGIRAKIVEQMPAIASVIDVVLPKKSTLYLVKCKDNISLIACDGDVHFFQHRDDLFLPTLRLVHKYPFILPHEQIDKGGIPFVISGANVMCPGLTSPGGRLTPAPANTAVAIMAEGKQHALAVGVTKMSTDDIARVNKGIGIDNVHYLNDGLWQIDTRPLHIGDKPRED